MICKEENTMFRKDRSRALGITCLALAGLVAARPGLADEGAWLKKLTVQIQVQREGEDAPEFGSGVVLCSQDDFVYIVTAYHVIYERQPGAIRGSRSNVIQTEARFFQVAEPVVETQGDLDRKQPRFEPYPVPEKDLLLLTLDMRKELPHATPGQLPTAVTLNTADWEVRAIGYAKETRKGEKEWVERKGAILRRDGDFLNHSAQLEEGFSGGPLFDKAGGLLGINIQFIKDPADESRRIGQAVPIDQVREAFSKKLPASCWGNQEELEKTRSAHSTYKTGIRAISLSNWCEAEDLMRKAIEDQPLEGGSVHLQGMRYTTYLPVYHLGLALYRQGRWGEAYRAFRESGVQGEIQKDRRNRRFRRYLEEAKENRETEEPSAASPCPPKDR
ncbi:MAG TPA: hypothetical protein DD490_14940 [Acidobacteria bacterium]|nr:hypothetical protein [Acidobacteriota bacterium]